ncbi:aminotransferase class V-fold PLP-dependent enzyme [Clostridia bacterium OttesenSCG-928-O13]|nr:aminotransferase class V-fold PLP-dependent enzyme [Clostridia bacterium OttesenSCG-928-O13]
MGDRIVYADNAATTPVCPAALKAMMPYFSEQYGNPSAMYSFGAETKSDVENARKRIAKCLNARSNEVFYTSGGTEADNWALWGAAEKQKSRGGHIITTMAEHSAVYKTCQRMESLGYTVTYLPIDKDGQVSCEALENAMQDDTVLVSIMMANNEIGTIYPIKELCAIAHRHKALFHTDAVQAVGHIPVDVRELGVDMLSLSAHKFGGPKGMGALFIKMGLLLPPLLTGGGQERGLRSGTTNAPGAMGMAAALENACQNLGPNTEKVQALRDELIDGMLKIDGARLTGDAENRLPGIASFLFEGLEHPPLVATLGEAGIYASAGSSCSAGSGDPSRILLAMGYSGDVAMSSLRFSLGEQNTQEDVDYILAQMPLALEAVRAKGAHTKILFH